MISNNKKSKVSQTLRQNIKKNSDRYSINTVITGVFIFVSSADLSKNVLKRVC